MAPVRQGSVCPVDVPDELFKITPEVIFTPGPAYIPRRTPVESLIVFGHIPVHRNDDGIILRHEFNHAGKKILPVVVVFGGVSVAVPVKVVDHRIVCGAGIVFRREDDTVISGPAQYLRWMDSVIEWLVASPQQRL